jgi:hypothetical protein
MNFLQKIVTRGILKSLEKLSKTDPKIRSQWEDLGKASQELAKSIAAYEKKNPGMKVPDFTNFNKK